MRMLSANPSSVSMSVTCGVVTLNEENTIGRALQAMIREASSVDGEVIVVAGGSDRTVEIVRSMISGLGRGRLIVDSAPRGKPAALNMLIKEASGDVVILTDGDTFIEQGSVSRLLRELCDDEIGAVSGRVIGSNPDQNLITLVCEEMNTLMHLSRIEELRRNRTIELASGYLVAVRKSLCPTIPENMNSDDGYVSRAVRMQGFRIAYASDAVVRINYPSTLSDFLKQKSRTRFGHLQLNEVMPLSGHRDMRSELSNLLNLAFKKRDPSKHVFIIAVAAALSAIAWSIAVLRMKMPWLWKKPIWQPIRSTK